jgi:hypothetical protein
MEVHPVSTRLYSLLVLFDMQTDFFTRALENFPEEEAQNRLGTKANHVAWLTGSLVQQRYEMANSFGVTGTSAAHEIFRDNQGIRDDVHYPTLQSFRDDWQAITPLLRAALLKVTDEKLDERFQMAPGMEMRYFDLTSFMIYREANCIGQIALWRRLLGLPAMRYM